MPDYLRIGLLLTRTVLGRAGRGTWSGGVISVFYVAVRGFDAPNGPDNCWIKWKTTGVVAEYEAT